MSSPDHPISNLEDVFSSNFPNYVPPASPDYVPTSPGKTYSSASNSFGIVPLIVLHHPSQPQALEIGETSQKSAIKHHEEQIQGIQGYLEEIPPERFEQIENGIEGLESRTAESSIYGNRHQEDIEKLMNSIIELQNRIQMPPKGASTTEAPTMTQDAIRKLVADSVTSALEAQAAIMASASNPDRNIGPTRTPAVKTGNYKEFISCPNLFTQWTRSSRSLFPG
ncbi:hypothetical protein Tco_0179214 [Tanacetum coccineum]